MCVFTGTDVTSTLSIEQFVMYFGRGKGRGRSRDFGGGRGSFGAGCSFPGGRVFLTRALGIVSIVGGLTSLRSVERSLVDLSGHS